MTTCLSSEEFERDAILFSNAFQAITPENANDSSALLKWELGGHDPVKHRPVYLIHPPVVLKVLSMNQVDELGVDAYEYEDETLSDPDIIQPSIEIQYKWSFSIVYSDTWMVPILYFAVTHLDGMPCLRSEVLNALTINEQDFDDTWDFISYEEHPITGLPSFFLHPCQTSERLRLLQEAQPATASLLSWAAMLLPAVGFRIPTKTFVRAQQWMTDQKTKETS